MFYFHARISATKILKTAGIHADQISRKIDEHEKNGKSFDEEKIISIELVPIVDSVSKIIRCARAVQIDLERYRNRQRLWLCTLTFFRTNNAVNHHIFNNYSISCHWRPQSTSYLIDCDEFGSPQQIFETKRFGCYSSQMK
jgi:hypothetical protein